MTRLLSATLLLPLGLISITALPGTGSSVSVGRGVPSMRLPTDPFVVLLHANALARSPNATATLVNSDRMLSLLWNRLGVEQSQPTVDFRKGGLIVIESGRLPTGGYGLEVSGVVVGDREITIHAELTSPGSQCATTQAVSSTLVVVQLAGRRPKASSRILLHLRRSRGQSCALQISHSSVRFRPAPLQGRC